MADTHSRIPAIPFIFGTLGFAGGFLIMFFGASLHDKYGYSDTYTSAAHVTISPGLIILIGGMIATLGLIGMVMALFKRT